MKTNIMSFQFGITAIAVTFALIAAPFFALATSDIETYDSSSFSSSFPSSPTTVGLTLPSLTSSSYTYTSTKVTCNLRLSETSIETGGSVIVYWETSGLDQIMINGVLVSGDSGSYTFDNILENTSFKLVGTNSKGSTCNASAYVQCLPPAVPKECKLELTKSVDKTTAKPGDEVTYVITVENTGTADCTGGGVKIFDEMDSKLEFIRQSASSNIKPGYGWNGVYTAGDHTLRWNGETLTPGEKGTITWVGKVKTPNQCGDFEVKNQAKATAKELDNFKIWSYSNEVKTTVDNKCSTPTPPQCPITPAQGRTIVNFGTNVQLRSDIANQHRSGVFNATIPAGNYDVTLVSWDGYNGRENMTQPKEQYFVEFLNGNTVVASSNSVADLADFVKETTNNQQVNSALAIGSATGVRAVHTVAGDTSSPNSLYPICMSIDEKPKEVVPSCDLFTATPTAIKVGESITLTWETTNASQVFINNGVGSVDVDGTKEIAPLTDTTYVLTAVDVNNKSVDCFVKVKVDDTPERPQCPFTPAPGRTIFNFTERLRSDQSLADSQTAVQSTSLGAGKYDIFLASWDGYSGRANVTQPNEQWQLQFLASGSEVGISNAISDVPDRLLSAFVQEQVNDNYVLTSAADAIRGVHAVYPDTTSANSVNPICAAVDIVEDPAPSCDLFTATPNTIVVGENATLTWETSNATRVVINNGIGEVAVDGSKVVSPLITTTYQLTVFGTDDRSVNCEVPVTVSEDPVPFCKAFTASPANLPIGGGNVNLAWEVEKATSVAISPTIGTVGLIGSTSTVVTQSTTFTLTAIDANGDQVSCTAPVTVPDPIPFSCENNVTFTASPKSITRGSEVNLNWNVTDADSVKISVIDATSFSGSQNVRPSDDTTYVLTAVKGNDTIECPVNITVSSGGGGGGSSSPRCELDISKERIKVGEEITLTWDSSRTNDVIITDSHGKEIVNTEDMLSSEKDDYLKGTVTLKPTKDTEYTMVAKRGSRDRTCRVEVEVTDDVVILETRDQLPLVAGISLSQVPYTGFEAGPVMTFMFYALLIAWAFYITYLIVARKQAVASVETEPATVASMRRAEEARPDVFVQSVTAPVTPIAPSNLPTANPVIGYENMEHVPVTDATITAIENRAHTQKALLSSDAMRHFIATTEGNVERDEALDQVISEAKKAYPLEDGWIVINESRMQNLCETCRVSSPQTSSFTPTFVPEGSSSLAEAIVTGNVVAAYEMIGNRPMFALADAAADLDAIYRNRRGESKSVSDLLEKESARLSDAQIKNMIAALTSALDGTYTDEASAVKMAIMKAVKEAA